MVSYLNGYTFYLHSDCSVSLMYVGCNPRGSSVRGISQPRILSGLPFPSPLYALFALNCLRETVFHFSVAYSFQCVSYFQTMGWSHLSLLKIFINSVRPLCPDSRLWGFHLLIPMGCTQAFLFITLVRFLHSESLDIPLFLYLFLFSSFNPSSVMNLALSFWIISSVYTPFVLFPTESNFPEI